MSNDLISTLPGLETVGLTMLVWSAQYTRSIAQTLS